MIFVDAVARVDFEPTLFPHQRQIFPDPYAAVIKEYVYEDLRLSLTAHRDGTLELRWAGGEGALEPQVLQERSVSKRT